MPKLYKINLILQIDFVNGLADENKRWAQNVISLKQERVTFVGDALVSAVSVSYIGPFSYSFRSEL